MSEKDSGTEQDVDEVQYNLVAKSIETDGTLTIADLDTVEVVVEEGPDGEIGLPDFVLKEMGFEDGDKVVVTLNEKGKFDIRKLQE